MLLPCCAASRLSKKAYGISIHIRFIILHPSRLFCHQKNEITVPPWPALLSPPICFLLSCFGMYLVVVVCKILNQQPSKAKLHFFWYFVVNQFDGPSNWMAPSPPPLASTLAAPLPFRHLSGWLWCWIIKRWPPKAKATPIALGMRQCPKQRNKQPRAGTRHRALAIDSH